jgi:quinol monooxygenase YgiN
MQPALELCAVLAYLSAMFIVHVQIHVKPDCLESFKAATLANARASAQEPGVARFDFLQQDDDETRFLLVEVYRNAAASVEHKKTTHYAIWRDAVAPMMATPRTSTKFDNIFPNDKSWERVI